LLNLESADGMMLTDSLVNDAYYVLKMFYSLLLISFLDLKDLNMLSFRERLENKLAENVSHQGRRASLSLS
jgi:hypothetical protein